MHDRDGAEVALRWDRRAGILGCLSLLMIPVAVTAAGWVAWQVFQDCSELLSRDDDTTKLLFGFAVILAVITLILLTALLIGAALFFFYRALVHIRNHQGAPRLDAVAPPSATVPPGLVMGEPKPAPLGQDPTWLRWFFQGFGLGARDMTHRAHRYMWGYSAAAMATVIATGFAWWLIVPLGEYVIARTSDLATHAEHNVRVLYELMVKLCSLGDKALLIMGALLFLNFFEPAMFYFRLSRLHRQGRLADLASDGT